MKLRPPVGFIVEGHGEYNCYPSLFCKISNCNGFKIPILNAGGCGSIIKRLDEQLNDFLQAESPESIIITVDLKDALHQRLAKDCEDLMEKLSESISKWRISAENDSRLHPLPNHIACIIQVRKFESWVISDTEGLKRADLVHANAEQILDVESICEPTNWLRSILKGQNNIKSPQFAKKLVSALDPLVMKQHSQSFEKFYLECQSIYIDWNSRLTSE